MSNSIPAQFTRNGKQVSGKSAGLDSYLKSLGYNQEDLDKLGQLKVDAARDKLTIEEVYKRLKEII